MSIFVIIITTLSGMGHLPAQPPVAPARAHYATLDACEAAARTMPVDAQHRAMCVPVEVAELAADAAV